MNDLSTQSEYQPDEETAHYVALNKMAPEDLWHGDLACINYLQEYYRELGIEQTDRPVGIGSLLDSLPTIQSSPEVAQCLTDLYQSSGLKVGCD